MQDYGLVSIIMPTWNCASFITESILSVLAQTYRNWELLIQDDCSNDNTLEVIRPYMEADKRIKYECNPNNLGAAITRNNALRRAKGRWIAFLDSDDLWLPLKLEKQLVFMVDNGCGFSCHYSEDISENGEPLHILTKSPAYISKWKMKTYCWVGCLTAMYDAKKVGLVQIEDIKKNNDYAIWLKVIKRCDCYCLPKMLAKYRIRKGSISRHKKVSLLTWHYKLWHKAEHKNPVKACFYTFVNAICAVIKKRCYLKKY